ncbi:hypothetical protein [Roseobacter sinensis]|uniref:hypothetical protein n=1 Tax=Roseobacter sinensis TaxID=2931391 RepID=UPI002982A4C3|nr:hypothetical protein [Roseobacter sp. WL0113]
MTLDLQRVELREAVDGHLKFSFLGVYNAWYCCGSDGGHEYSTAGDHSVTMFERAIVSMPHQSQ